MSYRNRDGRCSVKGCNARYDIFKHDGFSKKWFRRQPGPFCRKHLKEHDEHWERVNQWFMGEAFLEDGRPDFGKPHPFSTECPEPTWEVELK